MPLRSHKLFVFALYALFLLAGAAVLHAQGKPPADPARWEKQIAEFEEADRKSPPPPEGIVFVGSSSIRMWKLGDSFPGLPVVNRGFGGSHIADSVHYARRIVLPYRPRTVVFYAGENDVTYGRTPEQVAAEFREFVKVVREGLPETKIVFIGLKPSPSRFRLIEEFRRTNGLIREYIERDPKLVYVDVEKAMLGPEGMPREERFLPDRLHMNGKGYEIWTGLLRPHLSQ